MKVKRLKPKIKKAPMNLSKTHERLKIWKRLGEIFNFTPPLDGLLSNVKGYPCIDLFRLEKRIPNYDGEQCLYKGKPNYSVKQAIIEEYGEEAATLVKQMIK